MPTFVLMSRLGPETLHDAKGRRATGKGWLKKVKERCPEVKWIAHYAILGPYDFMDIALGASLSVLSKFLMIKFGMAPHVYVEGWTWMAGAGFLTAVTPAYLKSNKLIFLLVILIDIVLWCIVGLDLGKMDPAVGKPIVGWLLVVSGWIGVYVAGAVVCNTVFGRVIYPIPAPFVK